MSRFIKICYMGITLTAFLNCISTRVLKQTDTTAVIQGIGQTEFEAKDNATKKAEDLLGGAVKETQKAECNQEYHQSGQTSGVGVAQQYKQSGGTYYSCVLYFEKK